MRRFDIIIAGSDGLFDNISDKNIELFLYANQRKTLQDIYEKILDFIETNMYNKNYKSPY